MLKSRQILNPRQLLGIFLVLNKVRTSTQARARPHIVCTHTHLPLASARADPEETSADIATMWDQSALAHNIPHTAWYPTVWVNQNGTQDYRAFDGELSRLGVAHSRYLIFWQLDEWCLKGGCGL